MNNDENRRSILHALENVARKMRTQRALVLTESDLKCQVYAELLNNDVFSSVTPTFNQNITSISIHTETKFFNERGLLSQAPDIVITDPRMLSITQSINGDPVPSKMFNFIGPSILIELKFLKAKSLVNTKVLSTIGHDIMKGEMLNRRGVNFHLIVAVFDRFNHNEEVIHELFHENMHQQNLTCNYYPCGERF